MIPKVKPPAKSAGRSSFTLYFGSHVAIGKSDFNVLRKDHFLIFLEHVEDTCLLTLLSILYLLYFNKMWID